MLLFFENFRLLFGPSTQKSRPFSSTDGFLRNVIALFYFLPVLQAPESLDITAFLIRTNHNFNYGEFATIRSQAGLNSYKLSVKEWVEKTNAIGLRAKAGRYGGTYAYKDIAFEFGMWISPEFKIYLIKEFERLKTEEMKQLGWDIKRNLAKINYRIHTDAIKENLIPPELSARQISLVYANEADVLNMALFGMTAKEWRDAHPELKGNIRDYANVSQLVCLSNLENLNAVFVNEGVPQAERLAKLNAIAISQMKILTEDHRLLQLEEHK